LLARQLTHGSIHLRRHSGRRLPAAAASAATRSRKKKNMKKKQHGFESIATTDTESEI